MDKYKTYSKLIVTLLLILNLSGCFQSEYLDPMTLRLHLNAEPATLHPVLATDGYSGAINRFIFDSMIERDNQTLEWKAKMASHWEVSEDKKVYTFYLRKDLKWHDGKKVTADDVVYSLNYIKDPKTSAPSLKVYYKDVKKMEKVDDYTVRCHYTKPYFLALSFCGGIYILPKHILENVKDHATAAFARAPMGNGPYKFKKWVTNTKVVLERNEDYWDKKPAFKKISFEIIADQAVALQVLKKGNLDLVSLREIQWVKQTQSQKFKENFKKYSYPKAVYSYLGWNMRKPFFKDVKVRKAMTHLVDRLEIGRTIKYGLSQMVTGPFFHHSKQYNSKIQPLPFSPKKAKELLTEAGWIDRDGDGILDKDGVKFEFTILYPSGSKFAERFSTIFKEELKKLGVAVNIQRMEWAAFLTELYKRNYGMVPLAWGSSFESDPYQLWHSSQADISNSSNHVGYKNKKVDRLIEKARQEFDEEKRNQMYKEFHKIIHNDQPYTFLFSDPSLIAISKRIGNVKIYKSGVDILEWYPILTEK